MTKIKSNVQLETAYQGLLRHRLIVASCFGFAAVVLGLSTVDLRHLVSRQVELRATRVQPGTNRENLSAEICLNISEVKPAPELPPNLSYTSESYREGSEGMRCVVQPTWEGDRFGFTDNSGNLKIKPRFTSVGEFHDGLAAVQVEDIEKKPADSKTEQGQQTASRLWGFIDKAGEFVIKPQFTNEAQFEDGVAAVSTKGSGDEPCAALIDKQGRVIFQCKEALESMGKAYMFRQSGRCGLVDRKGKIILPAQFDSITPITTRRTFYVLKESSGEQEDATYGVLIASKDGRYGVINDDAKTLIPLEFDEIADYSNGVAMVTVGDRIGFADSNGSMLIEPKYRVATSFSDLIAVKEKKNWSVIDSQGRTVRTAHFDRPLVSDKTWFSEGMAAVVINQEVGFLNSSGQLAIKPRFKFASEFREGIAEVWDGASWAFIDKQGKYVSPLRFETATPFNKGKALVSLPGPISWLNGTRTIDYVNDAISLTDEAMERSLAAPCAVPRNWYRRASI